MTLLVITVVVALLFDFTNGFHDMANAVATSVSTRALSPRMAVLIAAVANLAGMCQKLCLLFAGRGGVDEDDESHSFADLGGRSAAFASSTAAASGLTSEGSTFEVSRRTFRGSGMNCKSFRSREFDNMSTGVCVMAAAESSTSDGGSCRKVVLSVRACDITVMMDRSCSPL